MVVIYKLLIKVYYTVGLYYRPLGIWSSFVGHLGHMVMIKGNRKFLIYLGFSTDLLSDIQCLYQWWPNSRLGSTCRPRASRY